RARNPPPLQQARAPLSQGARPLLLLVRCLLPLSGSLVGLPALPRLRFPRPGPRRLAGRALLRLGDVARIVRFVLAHLATPYLPSGNGSSSHGGPSGLSRRSGWTTSSHEARGSAAVGVMSPSRSSIRLAGLSPGCGCSPATSSAACS